MVDGAGCYERGLGMHAMSQAFHEYLCKVIEILFGCNFLMGPVILVPGLSGSIDHTLLVRTWQADSAIHLSEQTMKHCLDVWPIVCDLDECSLWCWL